MRKIYGICLSIGGPSFSLLMDHITQSWPSWAWWILGGISAICGITLLIGPFFFPYSFPTVEICYSRFTDFVRQYAPHNMGAFWKVRPYKLNRREFYALVDKIQKFQPDNDPFIAYEPDFPRDRWYPAMLEARRDGKDLTIPKDAMDFFRLYKGWELAGSKERRNADSVNAEDE